MAVVVAFGALPGTEHAGMTAYYRAPGCDSITIADVLPMMSKITHYEDEYVIGEMLIWDTGSGSGAPNNCAMARVMIYNDGWVLAWFDKETTSQMNVGGAIYVNAQALNIGAGVNYTAQLNGMLIEITDSIDPDCPIGTKFCVKNIDYHTHVLDVYKDYTTDLYHFNSGYTYDFSITQVNGNLIWWGHHSSTTGVPTYNSNRLYRAIYEMWEVVKYSSNSSNWLGGDGSLVYMYDSQLDTYTDETTNFNNTTINDCQVLPSDEVINDTFYIGSSDKFNGVTFTLGTPGVGSGITWEYWNGSAWSTLSCVDGSSGFTSTGELTFTPPDAWNATPVNGDNCYWIRARVTTAGYTTTPILTQGQLYIQEDIGYSDIELGMYNFENTGANYLLISGISESIGHTGHINKYFYNTCLPDKTIYSFCINHGGDKHSSSINLFEVNGKKIGAVIDDQNGFKIMNIEDIMYSPGVQNSFFVEAQTGNVTGYYARINYGAVLITS